MKHFTCAKGYSANWTGTTEPKRTVRPKEDSNLGVYSVLKYI